MEFPTWLELKNEQVLDSLVNWLVLKVYEMIDKSFFIDAKAKDIVATIFRWNKRRSIKASSIANTLNASRYS